MNKYNTTTAKGFGKASSFHPQGIVLNKEIHRTPSIRCTFSV